MLTTLSETSDPRARGQRRVVLALVGLCGAIWVLTLAGRGALATPPVFGGSWSTWVSQRDAIVIAFAGLRLLTLVVAWYLLGVTLVGVGARVVCWRGLIRVVDAVTVPSLRRLLQSAAGAAVTTAMVSVGPASVMAATASPSPAAVLAAAEPGSADHARVPIDEGAAAGIPLPFEQPVPDATGEPTWTVESGDHFWSIAQRLLTRQMARQPTDGEISRYWRRLIERNANRLVDPDNPDLLLPGQVLKVPAPPRQMRAAR